MGKGVRWTLDQMHTFAQSHGLECLSNEYRSAQDPLIWRCTFCGNTWENSYNRIRRTKCCCPVCRKAKRRNVSRRNTLKDAQDLAESFEGRCISNEYVNATEDLTWVCKRGHVFEKPYKQVKNGLWCIECRRQDRSILSEAQEIAKSRGGKCLAPEGSYLRKSHKTQWQCGKGHEPWTSQVSAIFRGSWCPECAASYGERVCRLVLEQLTGTAFKRTKRFDWLVNDRGNRMELDGYSEELGLAFEFHGRQHRESVLRFKPQGDRPGYNLTTRKRDDGDKRRLCRENGVMLLEVDDVWALDDLSKVLCNMLKFLGCSLVSEVSQIDINQAYYSEVYTRGEILSDIKECALECGRPPKVSDWVDYSANRSGVPSYDIIRDRFGTWLRALKSAGVVEDNYNSLNKYDDAVLLQDLKDYAEKFDQTSVTKRVWNAYVLQQAGATAWSETYIYRFGSWNRALELAGLKRSF